MYRGMFMFLAVMVMFIVPARVSAQLGTAFTYQGFLELSGSSYTGQADFQFTPFDAASGGTAVATTRTFLNVSVNRGVFSADLDFGTDLFVANAPRWLQISVRTPAGSGVYTSLGRQAILPAPAAKVASSLPGINVPTSGVLDVTQGVLRKGTGTISTTDLGLYSMNNGNWLRLVSNNAPIQFFTSLADGSAISPPVDTTRMSILPTGRVGIGTSAPDVRFHVQDTGNVVEKLESTNTVGTWSDLVNTSVGGRNWSLISTGSGNTEGSGKLLLRDTTAAAVRMTFDTTGRVGIGTTAPAEMLHVNGNFRAKVVIIDGADLAEKYDVAPAGDIKPEPGMVVSIDPDHVGKLRVSAMAFDRAVAGIVSGADGILPGLVLRQPGTVADGELPIANVGRVWCLVDADAAGPIAPGDLLTTSNTPGHAMRANDMSKSGGAILGKAMSSLKEGKGMVLVLVSLQ
jgi:hypothetical protein